MYCHSICLQIVYDLSWEERLQGILDLIWSTVSPFFTCSCDVTSWEWTSENTSEFQCFAILRPFFFCFNCCRFGLSVLFPRLLLHWKMDLYLLLSIKLPWGVSHLGCPSWNPPFSHTSRWIRHETCSSCMVHCRLSCAFICLSPALTLIWINSSKINQSWHTSSFSASIVSPSYTFIYHATVGDIFMLWKGILWCDINMIYAF